MRRTLFKAPKHQKGDLNESLKEVIKKSFKQTTHNIKEKETKMTNNPTNELPISLNNEKGKKMKDQLKKIRKHLSDNKKVYIAVGATFVVTAVGTLIVTRGGVQIIDSMKVTLVNWKSPHTSQNIMIVERRGRPGNVIQNDMTKELFKSQELAAELDKINPARLSEHLNGKRKQVGGNTYTRLVAEE